MDDVRVGLPVALREWDDTVSYGTVIRCSPDSDLVVVQFSDGSAQRMSLAHLRRALITVRH